MKMPITTLKEQTRAAAMRAMNHDSSASPKLIVLAATSKKRDNIFSKSRDVREDRGSRQMKTSHSSRTFPHVR
jgi:hypothetical protein